MDNINTLEQLTRFRKHTDPEEKYIIRVNINTILLSISAEGSRTSIRVIAMKFLDFRNGRQILTRDFMDKCGYRAALFVTPLFGIYNVTLDYEEDTQIYEKILPRE